MAYKTVFCPTIELERTGMPSNGVPSPVKMTLLPAIDDYGNKVKPTIIEANIIGISTTDVSAVVYDGVVGNLGDLLVSHHDSAADAVTVNNNGEFIIAPKDDDANLYNLDEEYLVYSNIGL